MSKQDIERLRLKLTELGVDLWLLEKQSYMTPKGRELIGEAVDLLSATSDKLLKVKGETEVQHD